MSTNDLTARLRAASARMECGRDCDALISAEEKAQLAAMRHEPLALLGWSGCPCTNIARSRFESVGACYVQKVWADDTAPLFKHLQCVHGQHHHSFVFVGGRFVGDGFALEEARMSKAPFEQLLRGAEAQLMCQRKGDESLFGRPLQSCTQSNDGSTTGWTRTGSCNWDPSDSGYHEVCVTMSDEFLRKSAQHDANDLSSVVQHGGHWCICAWAWASAVQRDPSGYEGITLECDRTNAKLRDVYEEHISSGADLRSPSGASYKAKAALDAVNQLCPPKQSTIAPPAAAAAAAVADGRAVMPSQAAVAPATSSASAAAAPLQDRSPWRTALLVIIFAVSITMLFIVVATGRTPPCARLPGKRGIERVATDGLDPDDKLGCYDSCEEGDARHLHVQRTPLSKASLSH